MVDFLDPVSTSTQSLLDYISTCRHNIISTGLNMGFQYCDADSCVDEACLRAIRAIEIRGESDPITDIQGYFGTVYRRSLIDLARSERRTAKFIKLPEDDTLTDKRALEPCEELSQIEQVERLNYAVNSVPPKYREFLVRSVDENLGPRKLAELTGLTEGVASKRLERGRKHVRRMLVLTS